MKHDIQQLVLAERFLRAPQSHPFQPPFEQTILSSKYREEITISQSVASRTPKWLERDRPDDDSYCSMDLLAGMAF